MEWVRGRAGARVRCGTAGRAVWWRRHHLLVTGAAPETRPSGGAHRDPAQRRYWMGGRERGGPGEPVAHPERDGLVGGAGGGRTATQSTAAELGACRGNGDVGVDSGQKGLIPWAGKLPKTTRSFWAARRSSRRRVTAGKSGDYEARVLVRSSQR
jgi:hypothetical protein